MRTLDLILVVVVASLGGVCWMHKPPSPRGQPLLVATTSSRPSARPLTTSSGRWTVRPSRYQLAGLAIGMSDVEIVARLGQPGKVRSLQDDEFGASSEWTYRADSAVLRLTLLEDRLICMRSIGGYGLSFAGRELPGFLSSPERILAAFGQPDSQDTAMSAWIYERWPGQLSFRFLQDQVSEVAVTGAVTSTVRREYPQSCGDV